jgi:hypothetical protein
MILFSRRTGAVRKAFFVLIDLHKANAAPPTVVAPVR